MNPFRETEVVIIFSVVAVTLGGLMVALARSHGAGIRWPWRCMLASVILLTLDYLVIFAALATMDGNGGMPFGLRASSNTVEILGIGVGVSVLGGAALFIASFLAMGLRTSRLARRTAELESLAATMRAELAYRQQTGT